MSTTTTTVPAPIERPRAHVLKRPRVGDLVDTRVGLARITAVSGGGQRLTVATVRHGTELIERTANGWWTTYRAYVMAR